MKRKRGKMVSWCVSPSHAACCIWAAMVWKKGWGRSVAKEASSGAPPMMKSMSKPRSVSSESSRVCCAGVFMILCGC